MIVHKRKGSHEQESEVYTGIQKLTRATIVVRREKYGRAMPRASTDLPDGNTLI